MAIVRIPRRPTIANVTSETSLDRPELRVAACQWINKHLRGDTTPAGDVDAAPLPGPELRPAVAAAFRSGKPHLIEIEIEGKR